MNIKDNKIMLAYAMGLLLIAMPICAAQQKCDTGQCDGVEQFAQGSNSAEEGVITVCARRKKTEVKFDGTVRAGGMDTGDKQLITKKSMVIAAVRACAKLGMTGLWGFFLMDAFTDNDSGTFDRVSLGWVASVAAYGVCKELAYVKTGILGQQAQEQKIKQKQQIISSDGILVKVLNLSWMATDIVLRTYATWVVYDKLRPRKIASYVGDILKAWFCCQAKERWS